MNMTVWEWFEQRSYHHRDFAGLALSSDTRAERPSTTLIFPARNVAGTIGSILSTVAGLQARTGLIDQVIVVDADSPDGTADVARAHGVEVFSENELLPGYGPAQGKGDAMWRALSAARGDIVMFADADTTDFEEHFVYGTLGPMLADPSIQFVKAAYRRPFKQGEESDPRRRRPGHRADGQAAPQPLLPGARRASCSRWRASSRPVATCSPTCRSSPATGSRSAW